MSAARASPITAPRRPLAGLRDPASPAVTTPKSILASTPGASGYPGDSPERVAKRARFEDDDGEAEDGAKGTKAARIASQAGMTPSGLSNSSSSSTTTRTTQSIGVQWVRERVQEMKATYKEAVITATFIVQQQAYSKKMGMRSNKVPSHLSRRFEQSWSKYEIQRAHIESYLLQCAQVVSTPSRTPPASSSLLPGLPPLPGIPQVPISATHILASDSSKHAMSLDKLAARDPDKGIIGYENGEIVFPGVPSDVPVPDLPTEHVVDITETSMATMPNLANAAMSGIDFTAAAVGDMGSVGLDDLGLAELTALINGENLDMGGMNADTPGTAAVKDLLGQPGIPNPGEGMMPSFGGMSMISGDAGMTAMTPNTQAEADRILASLGDFAMPNNTSQAEGSNAVGVAGQQNPTGIVSMSVPPPNQNGLVKQDGQGQVPSAAPPMDFDMTFSMGDMEGLGDIDFSELTGLFNDTSGEGTRLPTPTAAAHDVAQPAQATIQAPTVNAPAIGTPVQVPLPDPQSVGQPTANPEASQHNIGIGGMEGQLDDFSGGLNMDDFDFGGDVGPGGVTGDEFESLWADFS